MAIAPPTVLCVNDDVRKTLSRFGVQLRLDDTGDGTVNAAEEANLTDITYEVSEEIFSYLAGRYDPVHLAESYLIRKWARYLAAKELCERRGNPVPKALLDAIGKPEAQTGIYGRMVRVMQGEESLQSIPEYLSPTMGWVATRVNPVFPLRKARTEFPLSEQTPPKGPPANRDYGADFTPAPL